MHKPLMTLLFAMSLTTPVWAGSVTALPSDQPVDVNGYQLACTGIGDEAQHDPRWKSFPVRLEFADGNAQYLADVKASVFDASNNELFKVSCDSAWVLVKLKPGKYRVVGDYRSFSKSANFTAPKKGQSRIIVRFSEVKGEGDN